ncbi:MAG TPA: hypothetical protein VGT08_00545 [Terracidiphilus sp.]|nr:hypothetical protein [Terracidiphilus sp.]
MNRNNPTNSAGTNNLTMSSRGIEHGTVHTAPAALYIHKLLPMAVLYFFLNSAGLPIGLFYTTMLSPFFYLWLYLEGKRLLSLKFLVCLSPFIIMQLFHGLDSHIYYARSILLLWTVYVTVYALCWALLKCRNIERLFEELIVLNFCAAMVALVILFTPAREILWSTDFSSLGGDGGWAPRLKLLTSEPSVYGQLMAPLLIFTVLRLLQSPNRRNFLYVVIIVTPLLLSQSFGAISICSAGLGVAVLFKSRHMLRRWNSLLILGLAAILLAGLFTVPSPISRRVFQVAAGNDSSTRVRTVGSFVEAYAIAQSRSLWWGAGPGQAKLFDVPSVLRPLGFRTAVIPNSIADTLATFGIIGVLVKFMMAVYLFFRARVYTSTFRLAMFVVPFLYQFTGSNLANIQEYLMWCFAFAPFFSALDLRNSVPRDVRLTGSRSLSVTGCT